MIVNQINLQHCKAATAELSRRFGLGHFDIALIQEPYIYNDKVRGFDSGGNIVYYPNDEKPRTCIYLNKNLKYIPLPEFCSGDETTIKLLLQEDAGNETEVIICSAYFPFDSTSPPPSETITNLVNYCKSNNKQLILGCDANAHHTAWSSSNINQRGLDICDFLLRNNLKILNKNDEPTFVNSIRCEVLDITICTPFIENKISNWHVSDEITLSDHRCIIFSIRSLKNSNIQFRNVKKTDWNKYRSIIAEDLCESKNELRNLNLFSTEMVEEYANFLHSKIISAYKISCPLKSNKSNRQCEWFNNHLAMLRKKTRKLWNKSKKKIKLGLFNDPVVILYKSSLTEYNKQINKAKVESWRRKCNEIESIEECSRLQKLLSKQKHENTGPFKKPDNSYSKSISENLEILLKTHFPNSVVIKSTLDRRSNHIRIPQNSENIELVNTIVTDDRISWAINSFKPFKSPGGDGIFPALLQRGKEILLPHLSKLFKASLTLSYIPESWSKVNVCFIPKPGKPSYLNPKAYRPISLMSFVLKTLEKLIEKHIRETILETRPLHANQFAYQVGKSTDLALHCLVSKMEKTIHNKEYALEAFLDIEGAFDNTSFGVIERSLENFNLNPLLIRWIQNMLDGRRVRAETSGESIEVKPTQGTPQGGCLSALLWSIVIDGLLTNLNNLGGTFAIGYADDIVIYITGKFTGTVADIMQKALMAAQSWCHQNKLSINPEKICLMPVTRRYKVKDLKQLKMYNTNLKYSYENKFLWVILDSRLNWEPHIKFINEKAIKTFWAVRSAVGKTWGLRPAMLHWIYTRVVIPRITYGSIVWWHKSKIQKNIQILNKSQRMALLAITGAMKTTPVAALGAILAVPPIHIIVEGTARSVALRLASLNSWSSWNQTTEHCTLTNFLKNNRELWLNTEKIVKRYNLDINFNIHHENFDPNSTMYYSSDDITCFTDASKSIDHVGIGIYSEKLNLKFSQILNSDATTYQAEVYALLKCARICINLGLKNKKITIFSDNKGALCSLMSHYISTSLISECVQALRTLGTHNTVNVFWVPAHKGITGNEIADKLAKQSLSTQTDITLPKTTSVAKEWVKHWLKSEHKIYWKLTPKLKTSKSFISKPNEKIANNLLKLKKKDLKLLVGLLTGHCCLKKHLSNIKIKAEGICRFCQSVNETPRHILCECKSLSVIRQKHLKTTCCETKHILKLNLNSIINFTKEIGIH
jgi:ribonuclease HI